MFYLAKVLTLQALACVVFGQTVTTSKHPTHILRHAQSLIHEDSTPPYSFGVVLFPGFQALDVFGPLDALNVLSFTTKINLTLIAATLDPVYTNRMSWMTSAVNATFGEGVLPTHTFETAPDDIDVLIVPGGLGTRAPGDLLDAEIAFVRDRYPKVKHLVSVCTGAGILARAGVLDGRCATTNKKAWAVTTAWGPDVKWVAEARWVQDGNICKLFVRQCSGMI